MYTASNSTKAAPRDAAAEFSRFASTPTFLHYVVVQQEVQKVLPPLGCKEPEIRVNRIAEARRSSYFTVPTSTISNNEVLMRRDVRALSGALYRTGRYQSCDTGKLLSYTVRLTS